MYLIKSCPFQTDHMQVRTRFAPSPTGFMHLGNIWIALLNWLWTRQNKGKIVLRIEDIDTQRSKPSYIQGILDDLSWLGLDFDEGPGHSFSYGDTIQSQRTHLYEETCRDLLKQGELYPCFCSRARLHAISSAPHANEAVSSYDGHCRNLTEQERAVQTKAPSLRFKVDDCRIEFTDLLKGKQSKHLRAGFDDFVVKRADGMFAYQLAVSQDDGAMGITHVFRGNDLMDSTFYQILLMRKMGYTPPAYAHLPLLVDQQGIRLSKRQHGISVKVLRESGTTAEEIIGFLLYLAGETGHKCRMSASEALRNVDFNTCRNLTKDSITVPFKKMNILR